MRNELRCIANSAAEIEGARRRDLREIDKLNNKTRGGDPGAARVMGVTP